MAERKGRPLVLAAGSHTPDVKDAAHLPWGEIEDYVGAVFSDKAREAIFNARWIYAEALDHYGLSPTQKEVDALRAEIVGLCRRISEIHETADRLNEPDDQESLAHEHTFDALVASCSYGGSLRTAMEMAAECCQRVSELLDPEKEPETNRHGLHGFAAVTQARPAHVIAFDEFYKHIWARESSLPFTANHTVKRFVRLVTWISDSVGEEADENKIMERINGARRRIRETAPRKVG